MGKYGSDIPAARDELKALAKRLRKAGVLGIPDEIETIVDTMMHRTPPARGRTRTKHGPVTAGQRNQIKRLAKKTNPRLSNQEIADMVGVNTGRVSEVLHGIG